MPPGQPPGSLGFLAPTVLPLPSAASGQDSPGGPSASSPMGGAPGTVPPKEPAALAGKEEEGGGGSGGYKSQDTPSWSSAGGGGGLPNSERTPRLLSLLGTKHLCAEALPPAPVKSCNQQGETLKIHNNTPVRPPPRSAARSQPMQALVG